MAGTFSLSEPTIDPPPPPRARGDVFGAERNFGQGEAGEGGGLGLGPPSPPTPSPTATAAMGEGGDVMQAFLDPTPIRVCVCAPVSCPFPPPLPPEVVFGGHSL